MKVKLVFDDWREKGNSKSVYNTQLGVKLSSGDLHSGTLFEAEIKLDSTIENKILLYWKKYKAYPVFRVIPDEQSFN